MAAFDGGGEEAGQAFRRRRPAPVRPSSEDHAERQGAAQFLQYCTEDNPKDRNGLRQFVLRGLAKVAGEWSLACTAPRIPETGLQELAAARV